MKAKGKKLVLLVVILGLIVSWQLVFAGEADESAVKVLLNSYVKSIRLDDPNSAYGFERYYAKDARQILSNGKFLEGREQILQGLKSGFEISAAALENVSSKGTIVTLQAENNTAFALMRLELSGLLRSNGNRLERQTWITFILKKREGGWEIVQEQATVGSQQTIAK